MVADLRELLTPKNLRRLVAHKPIGDMSPWRRKFAPKGAARNHAVVTTLRGRSDLVVELRPAHMGCGYASFCDLFVHRSSDSQPRPDGKSVQLVGLQLWLSELAPLAVYASIEVARSEQSEAYSLLNAESVGIVAPALRDVEEKVLSALELNGVYPLPRDLALESLPFEASIDTNLGSGDRIFDAVFHWFD